MSLAQKNSRIIFSNILVITKKSCTFAVLLRTYICVSNTCLEEKKTK